MCASSFKCQHSVFSNPLANAQLDFPNIGSMYFCLSNFSKIVDYSVFFVILGKC